MAVILIVAHAPLASALAAAACHVYPEKAASLAVVDVPPGDDIDAVEAAVRQALAARGDREALVLADVFGATPCNGALRVADGVRVRLVAGVNVPMLWRALCYAEEPLERLVSRAIEGATLGVLQLSTPRRQNQSSSLTRHDQVDPHHHQ